MCFLVFFFASLYLLMHKLFAFRLLLSIFTMPSVNASGLRRLERMLAAKFFNEARNFSSEKSQFVCAKEPSYMLLREAL